MDIKELEQKREKEITGFFWLGLQIAFIFGIPAFSAAFIASKIVENTGTKSATPIALIISFIFSWTIVIILYLKKSKKLKFIETELKRLKEQK